MPFDTIEEIKKAITHQEEIQEDLRKRFEDHFDLLILEPADDVKQGFENYTSSQPLNVFDKIGDRLNKAQVTIQIKLPGDASEDARRKASTGELYLFGALADIDRRLRKIGEPPLREGLGWFIRARGWSAMRCLVYVPKGEKTTVFDVLPWDPAEVTYEYGPNGLIWAARKRFLSRAQVESEYGKIVHDDNTVAIDFWTIENNSVIVADEWIKEKEDHPIGHVPVFIGAVGSMPTVIRNRQGGGGSGNAEFNSTLAHRGDSVFASSAALYPFQNKWVGWVMDTAKRAVVGSLVHASEDGKAEIKGNPYATYQEIKTVFGKETITPLELPKMPAETAAAMQIISRDIELSTLPSPEAFGSVEGAIPSGRALSILDDATRSTFNPFTGALAVAYMWLLEELFQQFADQKPESGKGRLRKTTTVRGYDAKGEFFSVDVKPTEIDPGWFVSVKVEAQLPRDKEGELAQYRAATSPSGPSGEPAMSADTAREEFLHLQDPDAEGDKVLEQLGESNPVILTRRIAAALRRVGKPELADEVLRTSQEGGGGAGGGIPPEIIEALVEAIVQLFVITGQPEQAEAFISALQGGQDEPPSPAGEPVPVGPPDTGRTPPLTQVAPVPGDGSPPVAQAPVV